MKFNKLEQDIDFSKQCKIKRVLPNFTKIKLANSNLQSSKSTKSFRWQLVDSEISGKKKDKRKCKIDIDKLHNDLSWD